MLIQGNLSQKINIRQHLELILSQLRKYKVNITSLHDKCRSGICIEAIRKLESFLPSFFVWLFFLFCFWGCFLEDYTKSSFQVFTYCSCQGVQYNHDKNKMQKIFRQSDVYKWFQVEKQKESLHEKCPNTEVFLVRILSHSDWIRRDTEWMTQSLL